MASGTLAGVRQQLYKPTLKQSHSGFFCSSCTAKQKDDLCLTMTVLCLRKGNGSPISGLLLP